MKKYLCLISFTMAFFCLSGCCLAHSYTPATCTVPATCTKCGITEGEPLGHTWDEATCESPKKCTACGMTSGDSLGHTWDKASCVAPKTCAVCGKTEGDLGEHEWEKATCLAPKTCIYCGETEGELGEHKWEEATCLSAQKCSLCELTEGEPLAHIWIDATCNAPKHCELCGTNDGEALEHNVYSWNIIKEATCTSVGKKVGTCSLCNEEIEQNIDKVEHKLNDWEVYYMPTESYDGQMIQSCSVCGKTINEKALSKQDNEFKNIYKSLCKTISYTELARNPNNYYDEYVKFSGTVVQVCSEAAYKSDYSTYRVATLNGYDNVVYVSIYNYGQPRILENDYITFYGYFDGLITYETVLGAAVTIPSVFADIIE